MFLGFDFAYGYPAGFAEACGLGGPEPSWRYSLWNELSRLIEDHANNTNNRFVVAGQLNARCHGETPGPFGAARWQGSPWSQTESPPYPYFVSSGSTLDRLRESERRLPGVQPTWKLFGAGAVGGQTLVGIPAVKKLRDDPELQHVSRVWPFETGFGLQPAPPGTPFILHAEIWPDVVNNRLDPTLTIPDQKQVRAMVGWLAELDAASELLPLFGRPAGLSDEQLQAIVKQEGWILGSGRQNGARK